MQITLNQVRLSYVTVFEGTLGEDGRRSWGLTALVPKNHPQVSAIKAAIESTKAANVTKLGTSGIKSCLLDGDARDDDGTYRFKDESARGHLLLRCKSYNRRPVLVDQNVQSILDADQLYSGCYANVRIGFYAWSSKTGKGISPGLEAVQKVRDGERLGAGGLNANEVFSALTEDFLS